MGDPWLIWSFALVVFVGGPVFSYGFTQARKGIPISVRDIRVGPEILELGEHS
jgi:hypothetical protein